MKPIYLEMQAFGPFADKQCVDFEKLSAGGIFLIKGDTGSGKTTIFDALTFALYGGGSGEGDKNHTGRNDFEEWRCNQANPKAPTYVAFTFSVKGRKYRFERRLTPKKVNLAPGYMAGYLDEDGILIPFFENPKKEDLNRKAVELIGLTKEQFRQVVLLPQGQFERFLVAPSGEKEQILQKIFDSAQWDRYAQKMYDTAKERKERLDADRRDIVKALEELKLSSLGELEELIAVLEGQREEARLAHAEFAGEKKQAELNRDIGLYERFKPLHELERTAAALDAKRDGAGKTRLAYERAVRAEALRAPITEFESRRSAWEQRRRELRGKESALNARQAAFSAAEAALKTHEEASPVAELQRKIGEYDSRREAYSSFSGFLKSRDKAMTEYRSSKAEWDKSLAELNAAKSEADRCYIAADNADREAAEYRRRYFAGIHGELAAQLTEGERCPVCGSTHHPEPAGRSPDSVSREQWDKKEKASAMAKKAFGAADDARRAAEKRKESKENAVREKHLALLQAEAELSSARSNLIEGINDLPALIAAAKKCRDGIAAYENEGIGLKNAFSAAEKALNDLKSQIETAKSEAEQSREALEAAQRALEDALPENGWTDYASVKEALLPEGKRNALHSELVSYETSCRDNAERLEEKRRELEGEREPDSSRFSERQAEISEENHRFSKNDAALGEKLRAYRDRLKRLTETDRRCRSELPQAESDLAFARRLRGEYGMGLQRYVLAIMFSRVIAEANRMLKNVHNGRYTLFRSDEKGMGNKKGLELKVHDNRCPGDERGRGVAMLSGGEKFLVSLALSIGMSAAAQKAGVQIEALFIDEGFGTLDDSSIGDAMSILESVRRGSSTIGIISHIPILESTIDTKLEVVKAAEGSRIRMV